MVGDNTYDESGEVLECIYIGISDRRFLMYHAIGGEANGLTAAALYVRWGLPDSY
jgi:hypothetical protein